jgi:Trk K+ transport system NAD-binding subunit
VRRIKDSGRACIYIEHNLAHVHELADKLVVLDRGAVMGVIRRGEMSLGTYLTEARISDNGKAAGKSLQEIEDILDLHDAQVVGIIRNETRMTAANPSLRVRAGDILVIEAEPDSLAAALSGLGLKLDANVHPVGHPIDGNKNTAGNSSGNENMAEEDAGDKRRRNEEDETALTELAVLPDSSFVGRSAYDVRLRVRFGISLLGISRQGRLSTTRLRLTSIQAGDVLLLQGPKETVLEFAAQMGCVPLAERALRIPNVRRAVLATGVLAAAIVAATFGLVSATIAFAAGVLASMALRLIPLRSAYRAVDWPVIILLAALIPVAGAMASTGAADWIAKVLLDKVSLGHPVIALTLILVVTMTLSDGMNNAATAAVMCPIAIGTAQQLGANADPFLMAVAVGASCAFLTPIGHQNNTLILGPGGFRFGDYWRLGLPMEVLITLIAVPSILLVWPF